MKRTTILSRRILQRAAPKSALSATVSHQQIHTTSAQLHRDDGTFGDSFDDYVPSSKFSSEHQLDNDNDLDFAFNLEEEFSEVLGGFGEEQEAPEKEQQDTNTDTDQWHREPYPSVEEYDHVEEHRNLDFFDQQVEIPRILMLNPSPELELDASIFRSLVQMRGDPGMSGLVSFLQNRAEFNPIKTWINSLVKYREGVHKAQRQKTSDTIQQQAQEDEARAIFEAQSENMWQLERERQWCAKVLLPYSKKLGAALRNKQADARRNNLKKIYQQYGSIQSPFDWYVSKFYMETPRFDVPKVRSKNKINNLTMHRAKQWYLTILNKWRRHSLPREIQSNLLNRFAHVMGTLPVQPVPSATIEKTEKTEESSDLEKPASSVDAYLMHRLLYFTFFPGYIKSFDEVRLFDPDVDKLDNILSKWRAVYTKLTGTQSQPAEISESLHDDIFSSIYSGESNTERDMEEYKELRKEARTLRDALVLKMRVKTMAREYDIKLPVVIDVQTLKESKKSLVEKADKDKMQDLIEAGKSAGGHMVSYVDESGRKVMFEVPKADFIKTFRQTPGRAPEPQSRRGWKGKDYALEKVTDAEALRIREHFKYERDFKYRKFPLDLGPRVMDEWKVYERHLQKKISSIENPNFDDSLVMRKGALMNSTVDMTLNHAIQLCEDAWRKRYVPSEKSDKFTKALTCIVDYWKELNSANPKEEHVAKMKQAKSRFKQYMYRQLLTQFVKQVINQNLEPTQNSTSPAAKDLDRLNKLVERLLGQLDVAGANTDAIRSEVSSASYHHIEPTWFGTQLGYLREMIEHMDEIIDLQVDITESDTIATNHLADQAAVCEYHLANTGSLMYLHGARLSDVRTAHDIHRIVKNSAHIGDVQKRQVRELFRFCFQEFELFSKPQGTQIFDQF
mmetsp:Transcript_9752/g.36311  ORF Transcript_9752/g.36311 Transcript_9752/m.36311 type:complete len:903 (-) Transcript_9752:100-2808(-)|eukprot:CAMPEP_0117434594 /NCGR_PEP_ID=MMETSP0759-20121206/33_1 /TAXON_ID=63605 /ORGANISM="Percolomonas cosmopolitus, Strain WS" /LENGTH=902 /DNA_ID=CAMNT_0005226089 /DNA_START=369 /DNA_END=3077 /DNA_ORIENTATION=-